MFKAELKPAVFGEKETNDVSDKFPNPSERTTVYLNRQILHTAFKRQNGKNTVQKDLSQQNTLHLVSVCNFLK